MDLSWAELMVVGIVALIVIGPKDLPGMFRELGRFTAKLRAMGREFSRAMEQADKESGIKEVAEDLKKAMDAKTVVVIDVRGQAPYDAGHLRGAVLWDEAGADRLVEALKASGKAPGTSCTRPTAPAPATVALLLVQQSSSDAHARR